MTPQPNILFLFPDQHRPDWLGCNAKLPLRTPNLDRLCQRGTRFTNAYTPSPLCAPARACLATGQDYPRCGVKIMAENTPVELPNYYRNLRDAGYEVSGVGKFDLRKPDLDWGLDGKKGLADYGITRGMDSEGKGDAIQSYLQNENAPKGPYMHYLKQQGLAEEHLAMYEPYFGKAGGLNFAAITHLPDEAYCDNWIADHASRELEAFAPDKPWHLVVNFTGPHAPYDITAAMRLRWQDTTFPAAINNEKNDADYVQIRRQNYAAMIENIDAQVGRLIERVEKRGELDNTLIVFSSDHGEMLGDHGRWGKKVWYTPSSGIPLIMAGPGIPQGQVSDALVALHDLSATYLDYAGAKPIPDCDARSLRPLLEAENDMHRDVVKSALGDWRMAFDGRYKAVTGVAPKPQLFDMQEDPHELRDIADQQPVICERLVNTLG